MKMPLNFSAIQEIKIESNNISYKDMLKNIKIL